MRLAQALAGLFEDRVWLLACRLSVACLGSRHPQQSIALPWPWTPTPSQR
jgi:hypothetical protein